MLPRILSTALAGALLLVPSFAQARDPQMFSAIDVSVDLDEITNPAAAQRYTSIADDLKNAILALLVDRQTEDGAKLIVDLSEVELSNTFTEALGSADTKLAGIVSVQDALNNANSISFTLSVEINQAKMFLPETVDMTQLKASSDDYYKAMIQAFAAGTIAEIDK